MHRCRLTALSAISALALATASASPVWTTAPTGGSFSPAPGNILAGMAPSSVANGSAGAEGTGGTDRLTDGLYGSGNSDRYTIGDNAVLTYSFDVTHSISSVNFYSQWNDTGRDKIDISSIEVLLPGGTWETIPNSAVSYEDASFNCSAKLSDSDGGFIATAADGIRISFAGQENGYVGYLEIEAVGVPATSLSFRNPVTGNTDVTGTNAVAVLEFPVIPGAAEYQIVPGDSTSTPDPSGWLAYTFGVIPDRLFDFPRPASTGEVTMTAWFRTGADDASPTSVSGSITFDDTPPAMAVRDITIMLGENGTRALTAADLDCGTSDPYGIDSISVSPAVLSAPGTVQATVTAVNAAGVSASSTVAVTVIPYVACPVGSGTGGAPLPEGYLRHLLHLGADFDTDMITSSTTGGIDGDQLYAFGGQTNQHPVAGLVYEDVPGATSEGHDLVWTETTCPDQSGRWTPAGDKSDYVKYWHIYINVPGKTQRNVVYHHYNDDGLRVWNNGVLMVSHPGAGGEYHSPGVLYPGINSITIKLQEGGGGDYMQLRITDENGAYFDDLSYQFSPYSFNVADPVTGSHEFTSSTTLDVVGLPEVNGGAEYQFTASDSPASLDPSAWAYYDRLNPPLTASIPQPASDGVVPVTLWIRSWDRGVATTNAHTSEITFSTEYPHAVARDAAIPMDATRGTEIDPSIVDNGSTGGASGIYSMSVSPSVLYGPGLVTLTVMNNAGLTDIATAYITPSRWSDTYVSPDGDDLNGTGRPDSPWETITRALVELDGTPGTVYVDAGTYSATTGETLPFDIPAGTFIRGWDPIGIPDRADRVIDGEGNFASLLLFSDSSAPSGVSGLHLRNTTGAIASVAGAEASFEDVLFTQASTDWNASGAIEIRASGIARASGCAFSGISRKSVVYCADNNTATFTATNCLFEGNNSNYGAIAAPAGSVMYVEVDDSSFITNSATGGKLHDGQSAAILYFWGTWGHNCTARFDHCRFAGNTGRALFTGSSTGPAYVRDSLLVDNPVTHHMFSGYTGAWYVDNCTFVRCGPGFTGYVTDTFLRNCILYGCGSLTHDSSDMSDNETKLRLNNTVLWNTPVGKGYNHEESDNVIETDPWLENPDVAWDNPAFDARPRPYGSGIDAGRNSVVVNKTDLDGRARKADNNADGTATVDCGCYESPFHATTVPTFQIPVPGSLHIFRGGTFTTSLTVSPAVSGPVTATIAYGEGLTGPATVTIPDGAGPVDLTVGVNSGFAGDIARLTISEESGVAPWGIEPVDVDVFPSSNVVTIGGTTRFFLREGVRRDFTVRLDDDGIVASALLPIGFLGVADNGSNLAEWIGDSFIDEGESVAEGVLAVTGGSGLNTVTVEIGGGFVFAETGTDSVELTVIGHPGYLYVDPVEGDDDATGGFADPLLTVTRAIAELAAGDEVRLLPGSYTPQQETFPLAISGVSLAGCDASGDPAQDASECIVSGENTAGILVSVTGTNATAVSGLTLRDSSNVALFIEATPTAVSNVVFTQTIANKSVVGGIQQRNSAVTRVSDCVFTNMTRFASVYIEPYTANNGNAMTFERCLFADNDSECATVCGGQNVQIYLTFEDCVFRNNAVTASGNQYSDAFRGTAVFGRNGGSINIRRCQFLGGSEGAVIGCSYFNGDNRTPTAYTIDDSLFAGNYAPAGVLHGYNSNPYIRNCTFVGNTGGYNGRYTFPRIYNSIICDGSLSFTPPDGQQHIDPGTGFYLFDTMLWNVVEGRGYDTNNSSVVTIADPRFKNTAVAWDSPAFDARLGTSSPAIDAGDTTHGYSEYDLDGSDRLQFGLSMKGDPLLDLGCYEHAPVSLGTLFMIK